MTDREIETLQAVDIHSHFGPSHGTRAADAVENGSADYLLRTMRAARIAVSVNSSRYALMPRGSGFSAKGNEQCLRAAEQLPGVFVWVVVDPHEPETFAQAADFLQHPRVLGVKLHPEEHEYDLEREGGALFAFAAAHRAPILGHSGARCCLPETYGFFADRFPEIPVIAAHLGCGYDGDFTHQIRAVENSRAGNLYTDTSSAMSVLANLLEYAVSRIGSERILFGTDSSCYFSPCQRARVDMADIPPAAKRRVLRDNAQRLFPRLADCCGA